MRGSSGTEDAEEDEGRLLLSGVLWGWWSRWLEWVGLLSGVEDSLDGGVGARGSSRIHLFRVMEVSCRECGHTFSGSSAFSGKCRPPPQSRILRTARTLVTSVLLKAPEPR